MIRGKLELSWNYGQRTNKQADEEVDEKSDMGALNKNK